MLKVKAETYHVPVMLDESVSGLAVKPDGIYADVTFGGGGHSSRIVGMLSAAGHLYAFDKDADSEANAIDDSRFTFVRGDFRFISNYMRYFGVVALDGVIADLGVSSHHFDAENRGFSFRFDCELDMRMNTRGGLKASDVLNTYSEERLATLFHDFGEFKHSRKLAAGIVASRAKRAVATVSDFIGIARQFVPEHAEKKELPKLFQALRIEVNDELGGLRALLAACAKLLKPGGRLVVLTYHSLEDRIVKNFIRTGNTSGKEEKDIYGHASHCFKAVNRKVIVPDDDEVARNPRSRSAKLRIAEKL